jgi:hypothetical protein
MPLLRLLVFPDHRLLWDLEQVCWGLRAEKHHVVEGREAGDEGETSESVGSPVIATMDEESPVRWRGGARKHVGIGVEIGEETGGEIGGEKGEEKGEGKEEGSGVEMVLGIRGLGEASREIGLEGNRGVLGSAKEHFGQGHE